jgi:hypothetical protein
MVMANVMVMVIVMVIVMVKGKFEVHRRALCACVHEGVCV